MGSRRWWSGGPAQDAVGGVVVGVDEDGSATAATEWAAAEAFRRGVPLVLVTAHPLVSDTGLTEWFDPVVLRGDEERSRQAAQEVRTAVRRAWPGLPVSTRLVDGPVTGVLRQAAEPASLLVLGCHPGRWTARLVAGMHPVPTGRRLVGHLGCPLVVVGDRVVPRLETVVGWNGSPAASLAARFAADRVVADHGTLCLVHVRCRGRGASERTSRRAAPTERLAAAVAPLRRGSPTLSVRGRTVEAATVAEGLLRAAAGARLLVVGATGPVRNWTGPLSRARGQVTTRALLGAGPPVAVVPLSGHPDGRPGRPTVTYGASNGDVR